MYHGRKKTDKPAEKTPEELKKEEELANRITNMLNEFLEIRHGRKEVENPLEFCNIMVQLCPEIYHVYNFRREILLKKFETMSLKDSYKLVGEEIMITMGLLKKRPKCYAIWSHRQWLILKAFEQENQIIKATGEPIKPRMVEQDLMICSKMLSMDERNFHAWNYRIWLVRDVLKYNKTLVEKELEYLKSKIEDNFSNFSAFHFRSKHLAVKHTQLLEEKVEGQEETSKSEDKNQIINYFLSQEEFEEELEIVKNAIFIQPNEQGVWQYYRWLLSLMIPFQIIKVEILEKSEKSFKLKFVASQKISDFSKNISIQNEQETGIKLLKLIEQEQFSYTYTAEFENPQNSEIFELNILENTQLKDITNLCSESSLKKQNLISSKFTVNLKENSVEKIQEDGKPEQMQKIFELLEAENEFLNEVIEAEPDNGFSMHHKIFMLKTEIYLQFLDQNSHIQQQQVQQVQEIVKNLEKLNEISKRQAAYLKIQKQKYTMVEEMFDKQKDFDFKRIDNITNFETQELIPYIETLKY